MQQRRQAERNAGTECNKQCEPSTAGLMAMSATRGRPSGYATINARTPAQAGQADAATKHDNTTPSTVNWASSRRGQLPVPRVRQVRAAGLGARQQVGQLRGDQQHDATAACSSRGRPPSDNLVLHGLHLHDVVAAVKTCPPPARSPQLSTSAASSASACPQSHRVSNGPTH